MNNKMLERWKVKTKGIFHKIVYDEFWFYIDNLIKENKKLTNNWNELRQHIKDYIEEWQNSDDEWVKGKCDMARDILYDMKEIKGGK